MGFLNNLYIKKFMTGRTIVQVVNDGNDVTYLHFDNGEYLRLGSTMASFPCHCEKRSCSNKDTHPMIIVTPYKRNGEVKQSTEIYKSDNQIFATNISNLGE
jgi:hypothetical protein